METAENTCNQPIRSNKYTDDKVQSYLSERCDSKCKKSGPHFRYASTSTWVHGYSKGCESKDCGVAVENQPSASVTVRETFTAASHGGTRRTNKRTVVQNHLLNVFHHRCCFPLLILFCIVAVGFLVRFAQRELEWQRIRFPNYASELGDILFQAKTHHACANEPWNCVYCSEDMDHFLSLYDIFFCCTFD